MSSRARRFDYQKPDSALTLREGLEEYRVGHPELLDVRKLSPEAAELFYHHDLCHVIFGLDTVLLDEALADLWTMIGSDVGIKTYTAYLRLNEAKALFKAIPFWTGLWTFTVGIPRMLRACFRAWRMKKKWPWRENERYLDVPLREIRAEFGIRVLD